MIKEVFIENQRCMRRLEDELLTGSGSRIEIGAGAFPLRETFPDVLATDVVAAPYLDRALDAQAMDLPDASVKVIYGQHTFHHLPDPDRFFAELRRVLSPGGGAILIEPYWSPVASFVFKRLFKSESFDTTAREWTTDVGGAMSGANQALSYIVFNRDLERYKRSYPDLPVVHQALIGNYLRYVMSGGLNFRQLCPTATIPLMKMTESALAPFNRWIALHHVIVLRKEG